MQHVVHQGRVIIPFNSFRISCNRSVQQDPEKALNQEYIQAEQNVSLLCLTRIRTARPHGENAGRTRRNIPRMTDVVFFFKSVILTENSVSVIIS